MAEMLIRVNENMNRFLKELEKTEDLKEIRKLSILITDEVYQQWKEPKVVTHDQKMEMQEGEVEDERNN